MLLYRRPLTLPSGGVKGSFFYLSSFGSSCTLSAATDQFTRHRDARNLPTAEERNSSHPRNNDNGAGSMSRIMIKCLKTGQAVSTGMVTDQATWRRLAADWAGVAFTCEACDTMHAWIKNDAFLDVP